MHDLDTTQLETDASIETGEAFEALEEWDDRSAAETGDSLNEADELELATDLLSVSNEAEMDQFLGKLFKKAWRGIRKVGSAVGKVARPLAGALKGIAKKALPFVGGALGSFIPIPGVGTAVGSALGSAVGNALEMELEGVEPEDREFEMARRFVRLAHNAAQRAAKTDPRTDPRTAILSAVKGALRQQAPWATGKHALGSAPRESSEEFEWTPDSGQASGRPRNQSGRWVRHGNRIILNGI